MKKRLLALLLVFMLVVSLLPAGALAAGDGDTVSRMRLMGKEEWGLAAIAKAGYSNENVLWSNITSIRFFAGDGSYTNWGVAREEAPDCYSHEGYLATDAGNKIIPSNVDRIVVEVDFAYKGWDAFDPEYGVTAVFHSSDFELNYTEGSAGVREYAEFTLSGAQSNEGKFSVQFYFQPIGSASWELWDIVYVDAGESLGNRMPADPNYGTFDFVSWQTQTDGGGQTLTSTTVINNNWTVYGTKTSAGGATAYHVMRDSTGGRYNALQDEVADIYNAEKNTAYNSGNVQITAIQVNGNGDEHTNPDYFNNGWNNNSTYYYIYNLDAYAADATPDEKNTRIPVDEVTGITLIGTIDGNSFNVTIPKDELSLQEITNPGTTDTIVEIKVCDKLDGISKDLVDSADEAPEGLTGVSYPVDGKVTIPEGGMVTLLYKITVTGDEKAEYKVTDEGATAVDGYSLTGGLDTNGVAVIYVTKTFSATDVVNGVLTNSASLSNDNTTLPPDDGNDEDEVEVEVEDEGGEEPEPEPEPEEPRDPTDTELSKLAVVLECTNGEVEHAEKTKTFHMRTTNCDLEIQQFGEEYICTVAPDYEKILSTYNTATEATHEYEDGGKQFTLIWSANNNAWEVAGDASITRQVKCETPEPVKYAVNYHIVDANGNVIYNRTEYVSAGEYTDYDLWQPDEQAGCTFSGWFQKVEDLEKDHAEVTALYADKKWELYGRFTPDEPTDEWLQANVKIQVDCLQQSAHKNMDSWLIAGSYDEGTLSAREDGGWQYSFTVQAEKYLEAYAEKYGEHTANDSTRTVTLYFNDGKWENHNPSNNIYAVFDVKCVVPDAPTDVAGIFGDDSIVKIECITNKADHGDKYYQLKEGTYTVGDVEWRDGHWVLPITIKSGEYVAEFSYNHALTHTESKETEKTTHSVYWNGTQWTYDENDLPLVVFDTKCEGIDKPEQVESYDINVEVVNGTAEFKGTNIGANSVINVYPIENDNKNVTITFVPEDGFVFDAAYVGNEPVDLEDNSYTFGEVTADVTIKVLFKQDSTPVTPVIPLPTPGEISDLIKDEVVVDCVNDEMNHGDKAYGLLDDALVRIEKTDDTTVKVTLDATVYQAQYNTDTETKHDLADGQSATVTFALNYVDQTWRVAEGELPATIKVVCETPVTPEPTPDITGFTKELVTDRRVYWNNGIAYPEFYRGDVIVDEGDSVTLIYKLTVTGTEGTEYTFSDAGAEKLSGSWSGTLGADGTASVYVSKTFSWKTIRNSDALYNTAYVYIAGEDDPVESDTVKIDVDIDWDYDPPADDDDDTVYVPNWLNTTDHFAYLIGYEDGEIKPENNITRAEVATIFFRLLTDDARARFWSSENDYTDVATDSWYNNAVSTLSNMGIINGYDDGTFQPNASITRAEFTAIATRFFDYTADYDGAFNDVASGSWYADYVQEAVDMGLVDGYPDGGFHPNSYITRAEAVTIVNRVLNRVPHEDYLLSTRVMNTWPDNVYGAWYYADMQEATNSHDYDWIRVSGERVEEWTEKLTERDWAALEQQWSTAYSG